MSYPAQNRPYNTDPSENAPLLGVPTQPAPYPGPLSPSPYGDDGTHPRKPADDRDAERKRTTRRAIAGCCLVVLFVVALAIFLGIWESGWADSDPRAVAASVLSRSPIIGSLMCLPISE